MRHRRRHGGAGTGRRRFEPVDTASLRRTTARPSAGVACISTSANGPRLRSGASAAAPAGHLTKTYADALKAYTDTAAGARVATAGGSPYRGPEQHSHGVRHAASTNAGLSTSLIVLTARRARRKLHAVHALAYSPSHYRGPPKTGNAAWAGISRTPPTPCRVPGRPGPRRPAANTVDGVLRGPSARPRAPGTGASATAKSP